MEFEKIIDNRWSSTTYAESEKKALNNLAYQYKMLHGRTANAKITLPGRAVPVEREE